MTADDLVCSAVSSLELATDAAAASVVEALPWSAAVLTSSSVILACVNWSSSRFLARRKITTTPT